jgi:RND superfamily putative drug exporter
VSDREPGNPKPQRESSTNAGELDRGFKPLHSLANLVVIHPWRVVLAGVAFVAVAGVLGSPVAGLLQGGGFQDPKAESVLASDKLRAATGINAEYGVIALVRLNADSTSPAAVAELAAITSTLQRDPIVARVDSFATTHSPAFVSKDGRSAYLVASVRADTLAQAEKGAERIRSSLAADHNVSIGGAGLANIQVEKQVTADLARAETLAFPILFILLLVVFRGPAAAFLPLMVGGITIIGSFLGLRLVTLTTDLSIFALNLVTGMGLGLAIDYSLLMLSRYREESDRLGHGGEAVRNTMLSSGRTVLFSAVTVAAAMASLLLFPMRFLYSMGAGGIVVTTVAATIALTVLPAVLRLLGPRVDWLSFRRRRTPTDAAEQKGFWHRLAHQVMARPAIFAVTTGALLIALGLPFLGIRFTTVDASVLPKTASARQVSDALNTDFPAHTTSPVRVVVDAPVDAQAASRVATYGKTLSSLANVTAVVPPQPRGSHLWEVDVVPSHDPLTAQSQQLVRDIRALGAPYRVQVTGEQANFVDLQASLASHLPGAILVVAVVTMLVIFAMTGSVLIPIKTLLMNILSLSAAFGILVLIFQDGRLQDILGYTSQGALESSQPVLLFAIAFGLSTDYGVFLLSRIKEAHDHGLNTRESVAWGMQRTGRLITAAAILFCVAIGAFATSQIIFIKELGVGTAVAVLLDATIVRALLVPSLMALLGDWNWWAPAPLRRLHGRFGLKEAASLQAAA